MPSAAVCNASVLFFITLFQFQFVADSNAATATAAAPL